MSNNTNNKQSDSPAKDLTPATRQKSLDTFFPSKWLVITMVMVVVVFNLFAGIKIFNLEKEKAVIEILKARYESYGKLIRDIEDKEELLKKLIEEVPPLERRKDDAIAVLKNSEEQLMQTKSKFNNLNSRNNEVIESLDASRKTVAELSDEKQRLRAEKNKLSLIVNNLKVKKETILQDVDDVEDTLKVTTSQLKGVKLDLEMQEQFANNISSVNSSFNSIQSKLDRMVTKMEKTQRDVSDTNTSFRLEISTLKDANGQFDNQNKLLATKINALKDINSNINNELTVLKETNSSQSRYLNEMVSILEETKNAIRSLNSIAVNVETDTGVLSEAGRQMNNSIVALNSNNKDIGTVKSSLKTVLVELDNQTKLLGIYMRKLSGQINQNAPKREN